MIYLISVLLNGALAASLYNVNLSCNTTVTNSKNEVLNRTRDCTSKPCIMKCCGENEILFYNNSNLTTSKCTKLSKQLGLDLNNSNIIFDYSDLQLYKSDIKTELIRSSQTFLEAFNFMQIKSLVDELCPVATFDKKILASSEMYFNILDNGTFVLDNLHRSSERWYKVTKPFCIDLRVEKANETYTSSYEYRIFNPTQSIEKTERKIEYTRAAMLISSFFLLLVLLVYCVLPQLRNLAGMLLMAYVGTLLAAFLTKVTLNFVDTNEQFCMIICPIIYFLFQSSFLWLNVMSFDMWYTFRCIRLNRPINRHGEVVKFLWYALYAWGVAATMTTIAVIIDNSSLTNWPNVIKPGFSECFANHEAMLRYHYTPIGILTLMNIVLFLLTVYNIWLINAGLNQFSSSGNNTNNRTRFLVYVKMSLLMGIHWMLEVILFLILEDAVWLYILLTLYNTLIGLIIFIMFVFNMQTLFLLCKRFNIEIKFVQDWKLKSTRTSVTRPSTNKSSSSKTKSTDIPEVEPCEISFSKKS